MTSFSYDAFNWAEIILVVCPDGEISQKLTGSDEIQNLLVDTSGTLTGRSFTKKPTCESDGELKVTFSTGSSKTYTIPKSNLYHDYKVDAIKSEACANDGSILTVARSAIPTEPKIPLMPQDTAFHRHGRSTKRPPVPSKARSHATVRSAIKRQM